jgi:hypothetical protein
MKTSLLLFALAALLVGGCSHAYPVRHPQTTPSTIYATDDPETEPEDKPEPFIIRSPFGKHRRMDLTGMKPGTKVQDPTTGGIFEVPASKDEEPIIISEPPEDWQPEN